MVNYINLIINYFKKNKNIEYFIKFCVVGFFSALVDFSFYLLFTRIFFINYLFSAAIAFIIACTFNFYYNRLWTFRIDYGNKKDQYLRFLLVSTIGLFFTELILYILVEKFLWYDIFAKIIAIIIVTNLNFILKKNWAFKKKIKQFKIKEYKHSLDISVIIPVYNEEKVIENTILEIKNYLSNNFDTYEIIIVDDKSIDNTLGVLNNIKNIKILRNLRNHGKGYTVSKGVKNAKGFLILFMDADNSTSIKELDNFIKYKNDYDLLIASRGLINSKINIKQSIKKRTLGKLGNLMIRIIIFSRVHDTQCGFKLFNNKVKYLFEKLTIEDWGFDFELIFLARKYSFNIKELPVEWNNNFDSKVKWTDYLKTFTQVFKVRYNNLINKYK